jgi:hypothetical protein
MQYNYQIPPYDDQERPDDVYEQCRRMIDGNPRKPVDPEELMIPVESGGAMMLSVLTLLLALVSIPFTLRILAMVLGYD